MGFFKQLLAPEITRMTIDTNGKVSKFDSSISLKHLPNGCLLSIENKKTYRIYVLRHGKLGKTVQIKRKHNETDSQLSARALAIARFTAEK